MSYKMYSDGCHLREFNVAGVGGYLLKDDETLFEFSQQIEEEKFHTIHERFAIKTLLEKSLAQGVENENIELYSDDKALMKILSSPERRSYIAENNLMEELCNLSDKFKNISFNYIPRSDNERADKLSRKKISEDLFQTHQMIEGSFQHPKWISKNSYPRDNKFTLNLERKLISSYLVLHFHLNKEHSTMQLEVYYAKKENDVISYDLKESVQQINKGWQKICINNIAKHLNVLSESVDSVGVVLHDEYILLDQMLRGRKKISEKCKSAFDNLSNALEGLAKVVVHREELVYETIFNDAPKKMKPKI